MNHKCLDNIVKKLKDFHGGEIYLKDTVQVFNGSPANLYLRPKQLHYKYQVKNSKNVLTKKFKNSFVAFVFCPFCGKKYEEVEK